MLTQRQRKILAVLEDRQRVRVEDLAGDFATTPQTIRKDLQKLAELHHVVRFHGGATLLGGIAYTELAEREATAAAAKRAIGVAVAARIPESCAVFLNAGTTTARAAEALAGHAQVRVVVDNVDLAGLLRRMPGVEVVVPGGTVRRADGAILGAEAVEAIRQYRMDFAIIGAAALAEDGTLLDYDRAEVEVCRAMMAHARHVVLALDASKFGRSAPVRLAHLAEVHTLVTDVAPVDWLPRLCGTHEVDLVLATAEGDP